MFLADQEVFSTKKMMTPDSSRIIQMVSLNSAYEPLTHEPGCWPWLPLFKTECLATLSETLCKGQRAFSYISQQDHLEVLRRHRSESLILLSWKHYGYFTRTRCPPISRAMAKRARVDKDSALSGLTRLREREKTWRSETRNLWIQISCRASAAVPTVPSTSSIGSGRPSSVNRATG